MVSASPLLRGRRLCLLLLLLRPIASGILLCHHRLPSGSPCRFCLRTLLELESFTRLSIRSCFVSSLFWGVTKEVIDVAKTDLIRVMRSLGPLSRGNHAVSAPGCSFYVDGGCHERLRA